MPRPADPFQNVISAALAAKNHMPKPKFSAWQRRIERRRKTAMRSLERVLMMILESRNG